MRFKNPGFILLFVAVLSTLAITFTACSDDDNSATPTAIISFTPATGPVGTTVTITGTGFATTGNEVKFNGTTATVSAATTTQITVTVPAGATTGKITVATSGQTSTSGTDFTVQGAAPAITSFTPTSGVAGDVITITGTNFSTTASDNTITINGSAAEVKTATATQLTVAVPAEANTGKIAIAVKGAATADPSTNNFTILAPTITTFTPAYGAQNVSVTITGTHFSQVPEQNIVKFNGVAGTVTAATGTQLNVTMPAGASTGKVSVKVGPNTATSMQDLTLCDNVEFIVTKVVFTSISGDNKTCTYKMTILNAGAQPLDLTHWSLQTYASTHADGSTNDVASGGTTLGFTHKTLQSGESIDIENSSNTSLAPLNGTFAQYPYLIMNFTTNSDTECNTADDRLVKQVVL